MLLMKANIVKWLFTTGLATIALANFVWLSNLNPGLNAATFALIASAALFVRLLPGQGRPNRWANFAIGYTGSVTTLAAAWYWLESEGGIQSPLHLSIVFSIFLIITLVIIITALFPGQETAN